MRIADSIKTDANAMLKALDTDDLQRAARAGAAILGGSVGQMIRNGTIEAGRAGEVFELLLEIAHEFARCEAMHRPAVSGSAEENGHG